MQLTKIRVLILLILSVTSASVVIWHFASAIPASNINSVCEPGGCSAQACTYYIYRDTTLSFVNTNTTLARNCTTGANDFKESTTDALLQDVFNFWATQPQQVPLPPPGTQPYPPLVLLFAPDSFYITHTVVVNFPTTNGGMALSMLGEAKDKTHLFLSPGVNHNMFNITVGNVLTIDNLFFGGTRAQQSGASTAIAIVGTNGGEINFVNNEFRDWLTSEIKVEGTLVTTIWNGFINNWFLNSPIGIDIEGPGTISDVRVLGNKFEALTTAGIYVGDGNCKWFDIVGNVIRSSILDFHAGAIFQNTISGNIFADAPTNTIFFEGVGLGGGEFNFKTIIASNVFNTLTGTNVAINLARFVDGITVTSNQFAGYTSSSTVPVTLIQTTQKNNTLVTQNSGMGASWTGFGIAQPSVGATTANVLNTNPYGVRIYITGTGTGITAYKITDPSGTSNTFTTTVTVGYTIDLDPYAQVALTYTGSPTWVWYGVANLT